MTDTPDFGEKEFPGVGFPTPVSIPDTTACRSIPIPADGSWEALTMGMLLAGVYPENWQQMEGGISREAAAGRWQQMIDETYDFQTCEIVPTPFWDDEEDVDDDAPAEMQPWYGGVTDPNAPPGELDFVESALLWAFTGLVAVATFEVGGLAPAIVFHTTVEKFIILQKRGDAAETIRFLIDGEDAKFVNTAPYAPGEIISTPLVTPATGGDHTLMIIGGAS